MQLLPRSGPDEPAVTFDTFKVKDMTSSEGILCGWCRSDGLRLDDLDPCAVVSQNGRSTLNGRCLACGDHLNRGPK